MQEKLEKLWFFVSESATIAKHNGAMAIAIPVYLNFLLKTYHPLQSFTISYPLHRLPADEKAFSLTLAAKKSPNTKVGIEH